ncbi:hypothetical protein [Legionella tucsonensis]|uniref:Uncharacterized protein n=1 Tax=Legionella tucsonensis TaxID=40335 RepID=A0A0W0ZWI1_9GAMM|nr:hypothetical protein [Legionella tucsonensis]KTD73418.1 hypothetical protein Ltuc_1265 [Legionella tucsonensis]
MKSAYLSTAHMKNAESDVEDFLYLNKVNFSLSKGSNFPDLDWTDAQRSADF